MNSFKKSELLTIGFMMFSIFFGAGRRQARARHWRCWAS